MNGKLLSGLAKLQEISSVFGQTHRVSAYRRAISEIKKLSVEITKDNIKFILRVQKIPGVGEGIREKVEEFIKTGKISELEEETSPKFIFYSSAGKIMGVGPATLEKWWLSGITTIDQLKTFVGSGKVHLTHMQTLGLQYYDDLNERIPREEVTQIGDEIKSTILELEPKIIFEIAGSYRRKLSSSGDIDILISNPVENAASSVSTGDGPANILEKLTLDLENNPRFVAIVSSGAERLTFLYKNTKVRQVDILLIGYPSFYAALLYFTGDWEFNQAMRGFAKAKGFRLNQDGLFKYVGGKLEPIPATSEKDIFDALGLQYIEPQNRAESQIKLIQSARSGGVSSLPMEPIQYFHQITKRAPFVKKHELRELNKHNGQVKLFLTELEFMTECLDNVNDKAIFVYAGSAPSNKISYLAELFPNSKFVLVDPNEHYVKFGEKDQYDDIHCAKFMYFTVGSLDGTGPGSIMRSKRKKAVKLVNTPVGLVERSRDKIEHSTKNISYIVENSHHRFYIIEDLFTDELAESLKSLRLYFISDIRTSARDEVGDIDIAWNSALMYNWLKILRPVKFMLKFRTPWVITNESVADFIGGISPFQQETFDKCEIPFVENFKNKEFHFIKPDKIYMQAYAPAQSAESRLVGSSLEVVNIDIREYEEKLAWYNQSYRSDKSFEKHPDYYLALKIFEDYNKKYNIDSASPEEMFEKLLKMIQRIV